MPKFKYTTNQGIFEVESNKPLTSTELQDFINKQTPISPARIYPGAEAIRKPEPRIQRALPSFGQFAGGLGGFALGAKFGRPYATSAAGGTLGRGLGILAARWPESVKERPMRGLEAMIPGLPFVREYQRMTPELKQRFLGHMGMTGMIEAAGAGLAKGLTNIGRRFWTALSQEVFGARPAQRGAEVGFGRLLRFGGKGKPPPQWLQEKTIKFFPRLKQVTGRQIDDLISTKYKGQAALLGDIKTKIRNIAPTGLKKDIFQYIDDLAPDISKNQKELLKEQIRKILSLRGKSRTLKNVWELRKEFDDLMFRHKWHPDALDILNKTRTTLNEPLRNIPEIATAFDKYAFVREGEGAVKTAFDAIKAPGGEIYATDLERYTKGIFTSEQRDVMTGLLQKLDSYLKPDDKIIEDLIDMAMAETLEQKLIPLGIRGKIFSGMLGGRRGVARAAQWGERPTMFGKPVVRPIIKGFGRFIPTGISEISREK